MLWTNLDNKLYRLFKFRDFSQAFSFMTRVALLAEKADHHPSWTNNYNEVEIWLFSHDAGNIVTEKDRQMAEMIDQLEL